LRGLQGDEEFFTVGKETMDKKVPCSLAVSILIRIESLAIEMKGSVLACI
jgi:hypothetical protein